MIAPHWLVTLVPKTKDSEVAGENAGAVKSPTSKAWVYVRTVSRSHQSLRVKVRMTVYSSAQFTMGSESSNSTSRLQD